MFVLRNSPSAKTTTASKIKRGFFFPKKTAAKAVQPLPEERPGT